MQHAYHVAYRLLSLVLIFNYYIVIIIYYTFVINCQVVEEFYNIFGPELKAVTGDPRHIEDVLKRVDALVKPIEEVLCHFCCTLYFLPFRKTVFFKSRLTTWLLLYAVTVRCRIWCLVILVLFAVFLIYLVYLFRAQT